MSSVRQLHDGIAVVGWACRLPGANSIEELWSLLLEGRCAVGQVPSDRFSLKRFGHPRRQERGRTYTWAAGVLDDIWGFDPAVFGISPREAEQMDPQQRILLQLTWEAFEDAGIPPSSVAGSDVGVYVGASLAEYSYAISGDPAIADAHFGTGNALSILSNRISYIFDLRGPSFTVDTACSSSLVAMHNAMEALRSGRIDTAIVAGINLITSPAAFIGFSQASMLSPTGLCHAFSSDADGFVRAEGAVVIVLRKAALAQQNRNPIHGTIVASDVNSDGRTNGISLPSLEAQQALLDRIYSRAGISANRLAFIEAHGTGTPAGDPIEATAIGRALGQGRNSALPIGSIKTNIGHLEAGSGIAGVVKSILALNNGVLPKSLHFNEPNPHIDFDGLKLNVCDESLLLDQASQQYAGVNSFGFGGTNAHVIVAGGPKTAANVPAAKKAPAFFSFSAETKPALVALAKRYSETVADLNDAGVGVLASAAAHRREHLTYRVAISSTKAADVTAALSAFIDGRDHERLTVGEAVGRDLPVAFVYSGNGSQWAGMGLKAYRNSSIFREHFEKIDKHFKGLAGWSLSEALFSDTLEEKLHLTSVAQPLIFAIQSASTQALRRRGIRPVAVLGHSVGEVAAAEAAGILDLKTAVKTIFSRSKHQEAVRGNGRMAALLASNEAFEELKGSWNVELAAVNSPRSITIAGPGAELGKFGRYAKSQGTAFMDLDLDYPFHTSAMDPIEDALIGDLQDVQAAHGDVPFISTVTGSVLPGKRLNGRYWWRNIREPVQFSASVQQAKRIGASFFIEIGPRSLLQKHIDDSLQNGGGNWVAVSTLERNDPEADPFDKVVNKVIVNGGQVDRTALFGSDTAGAVPLPSYPWQQDIYRWSATPEAMGIYEGEPHPLSGTRYNADTLEWRSFIDTAVTPELADHKVGENVILPGTGFVEIALDVARQWLQTEHVSLSDFEILKPIDLSNGETREVMTRVSPISNSFEIMSRARLSPGGWTLNCRGKMLHGLEQKVHSDHKPAGGVAANAATIYRLASGSGLHYGPKFRLAQSATVHDNDLITVELQHSSKRADFLLDPFRVDAAIHGYFLLFPDLRTEERGVTYIPVRLDQINLVSPRAIPHRAVIELLTRTERSLLTNVTILDEAGDVVAQLLGVRCQAVPIRRASSIENSSFVELPRLIQGPLTGESGVAAGVEHVASAVKDAGYLAQNENGEGASLLLEAWATAAAYEIMSSLASNGSIDLGRVVQDGNLSDDVRVWLDEVAAYLSAAGLLREDDGALSLIPDDSLPRSAELVKALGAEHPELATELLLAAEITGRASRLASDVSLLGVALSPVGAEFNRAASGWTAAAGDAVATVLAGIKSLWPKNRNLRILQVGHSALTARLLAATENKAVQFAVFEPDDRRYDQLQASSRASSVQRIKSAEELASQNFDLIVSVQGLSELTDALPLSQLRHVLSERGLLVSIEPQASLHRTLTKKWPGKTAELDRARLASQWSEALAEANFADPRVLPVVLGESQGLLVLARSAGSGVPVVTAAPDSVSSQQPVPKMVWVAVGKDPRAGQVAQALRNRLQARGPEDFDVVAEINGAGPPGLVISFVSAASADDPTAQLAAVCLDIKQIAEKLGTAKLPLWLVFSGALASAQQQPVQTGAWAFSRTLANEFPNLDVRRLDLDPALSPEQAAQRIDAVIASGTDETELQIGADHFKAVRADTLDVMIRRAPGNKPAAATLERRSTVGQRLHWRPIELRKPSETEIEIQVDATGVNFRDLMWMLGLLPDEILEDGFTGPSLGLECAGRVTRVGKKVTNLQAGDRVFGFVASAFSTHVTGPASYFAKIPEGMTAEAAATIPVAFATAYYSLVTLANLSRNEWVLIHAGAGGVGMAAIQIAQSRGAKIIATAGSQAKRDLLLALGVDHVLDSRRAGFADEVRNLSGKGVDVVLNSLAGEAMERSIACLRPFGRFIELGKRDFVSNTHVGVRPFRRNLSYFAVDLDQLIAGREEVGQKVFADLIKLFAEGVLTPLLHSVFPGAEVSEAFHLMQQSGHIGKIVVTPIDLESVGEAERPFVFDPKKTHLITGAFGGFGLEAAKWLVHHGVRNLVMLSRSGANTDEAKAALDAFTEQGVKVLAERCDIADRRALEKVFEKMQSSMPPLAGVLHSAMVLDDAIVSNLNAERLTNVLRPKVKGADNLDLLTRGMKLDYFVLFSSVTTLIGNPGQGAYVAANAYMEGLARSRRRHKLPALAVGWGPISDVGVVARSRQLQGNLQKVGAGKGMTAREGLDLMAQALAKSATAPDLAVITIAHSDGIVFAADRLPVLRSPTYARLVSRNAGKSQGGVEKIDLQALLSGSDAEAAHGKVSDAIVKQLARVLRFREDDISRIKALGEMGLDSLMALELAMNLEEVFDTQLTLVGGAGELTVTKLADEIIAQATAQTSAPHVDKVAAAVVAQHHSRPDDVQVAAVEKLLGSTKR